MISEKEEQKLREKIKELEKENNRLKELEKEFEDTKKKYEITKSFEY